MISCFLIQDLFRRVFPHFQAVKVFQSYFLFLILFDYDQRIQPENSRLLLLCLAFFVAKYVIDFCRVSMNVRGKKYISLRCIQLYFLSKSFYFCIPELSEFERDTLKISRVGFLFVCFFNQRLFESLIMLYTILRCYVFIEHAGLWWLFLPHKLSFITPRCSSLFCLVLLTLSSTLSDINIVIPLSFCLHLFDISLFFTLFSTFLFHF